MNRLLAKLLTATLVSLCAVPQIAFAINRCTGGNHYATQNLGTVMQSPITVRPTGDPQVSPTSTTLTFSKPGPFSIQVAFNYEPECPGELYEVTFTGTWVPASNVFYHPKYQVVGVFYAPPGTKTGSRSSVTYGTSDLSGTTINTSASYEESETTTLTAKGTIPIGTTGTALTITGSVASTTSQTDGTSQSNTVTSTSSTSYQIDGDLIDGIDHSQDVIRIWLNPIFQAYVTSTAVENEGVVADGADPVTQDTDELDTVDVPVSVLQQLAAGASAEALGYTQLNRAWAAAEWTNGSPALEPSDYKDVLKADPFIANPALSVVDNSRFDLVSGAPVIPYNPTPSPESTTYSLSTQTTTTLGQSATDTHSTTVSVDGQYGTVGNNVDLKVANTWTTTNMWSSSNTSGQTQSASLTVWTPATSDGYTGPHVIAVYKDNVYGTFVFYPVPGT